MELIPHSLSLFLSTFSTLLAIINPLESLPVFIGLLKGKDQAEHVRVARESCTYAAGMLFFFLAFGNLTLRVFGVPLSMVRIVGGIILMRIGFGLFDGSAADSKNTFVRPAGEEANIAFIPLAMPLMFGPGALATVLGTSATVEHPLENFGALGAICAAITLTMLVTYLILAYAGKILNRIGPNGIDAATRIVGFFVSAMGMGLIFHGLIDALRTNGLLLVK
jgi:multiple antibiotic resistance protein